MHVSNIARFARTKTQPKNQKSLAPLVPLEKEKFISLLCLHREQLQMNISGSWCVMAYLKIESGAEVLIDGGSHSFVTARTEVEKNPRKS